MKQWINEVKAIQLSDNITYKEALRRASLERKRLNRDYKTVKERSNFKKIYIHKRKQKVSLKSANKIFKNYYKFNPLNALLDIKKKNKKILIPNSKNSYLYRKNGPSNYDMKGIDDGMKSNIKDYNHFKKINTPFYRFLKKNLMKNEYVCDTTADTFYSNLTEYSYNEVRNLKGSSILDFNDLDDDKNYILRIKIEILEQYLPAHSIVLVLYEDTAYIVQSYVDLYKHKISVYNRRSFLKDFKNLDIKKFLKYFVNYSLNLKYTLKYLIRRTVEYINGFKEIFTSYEFTVERLLKFYEKYNPEKATRENIDKILTKYAGNEDILFERLGAKYDTIITSVGDYNYNLEKINNLPKSKNEDILELLIVFIQDFLENQPKILHIELMKWKKLHEIENLIVNSKGFSIKNIYKKGKKYFTF